MPFSLHKEALDNLPEGITIQDTDFNIIYQNRVMIDAFGDHSGAKCYVTYERRDEVCEGCGVREAFRTGRTHVVLRTAIETDGATSYWENICSPVFDEEGNIIAGVEVCRNITDRVSLEEAVKERNIELGQLNRRLRQDESRLDAILSSLAAPISMMDGDLTITWANAAARGVFGDDLVGKKCHEAYFGREQPCEPSPCLVRQTFADGSDHLQDVALVDANGRTRHFHCTASVAVRDDAGRPSEVIEILSDITDRIKSEEKLARYATELERANEDVKQFAYIVSHDLRAPLVNMKGFAAELGTSLEALRPAVDAGLEELGEGPREEAERALREDVPEALGFIESSVGRMDRLINALLGLSRLGRRELKPVRVSLERVVAAVLDGLSHHIRGGSVEVSVGDLPDVVADPTAMEQIVGNVLANAVNYLEPGRAGEIEVGGAQDPETTTFFVRDNGRGIAEEDMPKVFAPFRRAGRQDVQGEGMGLAAVQTLVRRHGGGIQCESVLGVGTTFTVTLPTRDPEGGGND